MTNWRPKKPPFAKHKKKIFTEIVATSEFIYQIGESEALRKASKEIPLNKIKSKETKVKINYLKKCLLKFRRITGHGRGITGVQVGIPERISVIYLYDKFTVIVNPKITKRSKKLYIYPEMCMSALPMIVPVTRPAYVEVDYYDENGKLSHWNIKDKTDADKMMNRVLQHELDHMDGIMDIDLVKSPKELFIQSDPKFYDNAKFEKV